MILQDRDEEILRRCYEQQFLLVDHVQRRFFGGDDPANAKRRLRKLESAGWIRRDRLDALSGKRIIRLTRQAIEHVETGLPYPIPQSKRLDLNTIRHDALVTSVRFRLEELWDAVWVPERALKSGEFSRIPDGVFVFDSGAKVAVEVESSLKGRTRFLSLLEEWRGTSMRHVLFVAGRSAVYDRLKDYFTMGPRVLPFALVKWTDLQAGKPAGWSVKGPVDLFGNSMKEET